MTRLATPPPCVGQSELFDSRRLEDHMEAKAICATCPLINECAELLLAAQAAATGGGDGYPQGTWAGQFIGEPETRKHAKCGTDSGYYQHNRRGEAACEPCLKARREAERRRAAAKRVAS